MKLHLLVALLLSSCAAQPAYAQDSSQIMYNNYGSDPDVLVLRESEEAAAEIYYMNGNARRSPKTDNILVFNGIEVHVTLVIDVDDDDRERITVTPITPGYVVDEPQQWDLLDGESIVIQVHYSMF